ncbi:MAG: hypothetical protein KDE03_00860 [Rhodobacteraceae bacterium]|nr:hypothetical protein [Paracoccaceae bacterium]
MLKEVTAELSAAERQAIADALRMPVQRIARIKGEGRALWLKRCERLPWHLRLRKGAGAAALAADLEALKDLAARGLPVPPVLDSGPDHFVTPDLGRPLHHLLLNRRGEEALRLAAFRAAGRALAAFHRQGIRHGRPSVRDMLWDGNKVWLIDFERYRAARNAPDGCAEDALIAVHSVLSYGRGPGAELDAMVAAYRGAAPDPIWPIVRARALRLRALAGLARGLRAVRPRSNELRAFTETVEYIRKQPG